jgi:transcriptional regulator with GAF, ATPase, and Fis domain
VRVHNLVEAERKRLLDENTKLRRELTERFGIRNIVGSSRAMQAVYEQVAQVAPASTTVLVRGESGTGKELVAHAIHYSSPRAKKPFVKVSCAALPESLIESELFGYEPGAFTDARTEKKGRFELAHGGTIFLDEIGELPKGRELLKILDDKMLVRVGGTTPRHPTRARSPPMPARSGAPGRVRAICSIARDHPDRDPTLRERPKDLRALIYKFLQQLGSEFACEREISSRR